MKWKLLQPWGGPYFFIVKCKVQPPLTTPRILVPYDSQLADGTQFESLFLLLSREYQSICPVKHPLKLLQSLLPFWLFVNTSGNKEVWLSVLRQASNHTKQQAKLLNLLKNLCIITISITNVFGLIFHLQFWVVWFWLSAVVRSPPSIVWKASLTVCRCLLLRRLNVCKRWLSWKIHTVAILWYNGAQVALLSKLPNKITVSPSHTNVQGKSHNICCPENKILLQNYWDALSFQCYQGDTTVETVRAVMTASAGSPPFSFPSVNLFECMSNH